MNIHVNHPGIFMTCAILFCSCSHQDKRKDQSNDKPVVVRVASPVQKGGEKIILSGQVESCETAFISTRMMGFISSIKVKPGEHVHKSQLLVTISNEDIAAKRDQAAAMISEAEFALKDAEQDFERFKTLHQQQSASQKEFENAALRYHSFKAKTEAAKQLKNEADAMLAYSSLVAPFDGIITQKYVDQGSMANPGMPILVIERSDCYEVRASVSENEIDKVQIGMKATVTIKSTGKTFRGTVHEISPSSQFTGGQYEIKVTLPKDASAGMFSGMDATVTICLENQSGFKSLYVPLSAIVHRDQLSGIYTVSEDTTAQLRWLKVGRELEGHVEVLSGLNPGETFIIQSEGRLYSGAAVSIR
ncbi:MAG TPA: efflux RND transporter periplasmic adaptor subunit [Chryseolinea sp.]